MIIILMDTMLLRVLLQNQTNGIGFLFPLVLPSLFFVFVFHFETSKEKKTSKKLV